MTDVVLDETEWVRAILADTDQGDILAARLVACIQQWHRWVLTPAIKARYRQQYRRRVRHGGPVALEMIKSFSGVMYESGKCIESDDDPPVVEGDYHAKDRHVVSAAAWAKGSVVVTSDKRLADQLKRAELPSKYGFAVLTSAEALAGLCPGL
ncbi:MAG: hypothetical protein KGJ86_05875 [Chloroflexota bacterium]|nr:hypothetical protein [Chloroflexota bacterium]